MKRYGINVMMGLFVSMLFGMTGCGGGSGAGTASIEKAETYRQNGLIADSKKELIEIIYSKDDKSKPEAYYMLGTIAFGEKNISAALDAWKKLVDKFPKSTQAGLVKDRVKQLAEITGEIKKVTIENAVAQSYLQHADFWSEKKREVFMLDASWIPMVEAAVKWYDKVIQEFPKSVASRIAYEGKMKTLIGWEESAGLYSREKHGIKSNFNKYMPQLLSTFTAFEAEHPEASSLQSFRYQIAQAYWSNKDWNKTREWLKLVGDKSGTNDSFYKDLAKRRLEKVEY
ncbi:MAG: tetratricopeptide repeat protein [Deltaproteobacteria bacterium]